MEHAQSSPTLDQRRVRGQYESTQTDTAFLTRELVAPQDLGRLVEEFDIGVTPLRDVGEMVSAQRDVILNSYEHGTSTRIAAKYPELFIQPVTKLHERVVDGEQDQTIGHNFFVNATGFLNAGLPWAHQLNNLFQTRNGYSLYDLARVGSTPRKDQLLAHITDTPDSEMTVAIATYLAGRSREGERYLTQEYGHILEQTKAEAFAITNEIGSSTGLRIDMLERAAKQLHRTTFGSFDHLMRPVTSHNSGSDGDYRIGSLRLEVQFEGHMRSARVRTTAEAHHIIAHELQHAGSAQAEGRCGLQANGQGLEANEGMTEYLAQLSIGSPDITHFPDGRSQVNAGAFYRVPVFAMLSLHEQFKLGKNHHFATLFNAYHGDTRSAPQLEQALDAFYDTDANITRLLTH